LRQAVGIGAYAEFELAKTTLCLKGYRLYRDVWCDHPPVHTFLLTQVLRHVSPSVAGPRLVSVGFAVLLLVSVFLIVLRVGERVAAMPTRADTGASLRQAGSTVLQRQAGSAMALWAAVATGVLVASPGFVELSASCMMEIPALAPAIAALAVLLWGRESRWHGCEVLAGVLFGIGLGMKLLGAMLLPLAAFSLWVKQAGQERGEWRTENGEGGRKIEGRKMGASLETPSCHQSFCQPSLLAWVRPAGLVGSLTVFLASPAVCRTVLADLQGLLWLRCKLRRNASRPV
jgi:hypothetical protein